MNQNDMAPLGEIMWRIAVYAVLITCSVGTLFLIAFAAAGFVGWAGQ